MTEWKTDGQMLLEVQVPFQPIVVDQSSLTTGRIAVLRLSNNFSASVISIRREAIQVAIHRVIISSRVLQINLHAVLGLPIRPIPIACDCVRSCSALVSSTSSDFDPIAGSV